MGPATDTSLLQPGPLDRAGPASSGRPSNDAADEFWRGFVIQSQVVWALVIRETRTRFGAQRLGYLWAVLEPALWIATFWGMYAIANRRIPHDLAPLPFLATAILTYELFSNNVSRIGDAINGNKGLLFYPQVHPIDLVWARALLESATIVLVFVALMLGGALVTREIPRPDDLLRVGVGLALSALLGTSVGLVLCMLGVVVPVVERLRGPIMRPMFWLSGLFYTLDDAPVDARPLLLWNPVLHVIEYVRDGWFAEYESPEASALYVLGYVLFFFTLGLALERVVRKRIDLS
jgi:capsular polysaccharide transport system permease protein